MEDILASIKRIIAEDAAPAQPAPRARRASADAAPPAPAPILELVDPVPAPAAAAPPPAPQPESKAEPAAVPAPPASAPEVDPTIVSARAAAASRQSLAALSALVIRPDTTHAATLDDLVREMLRPMLKDWLDARLPEMVETLVAREIARITGGSF